MNQTTQTDLVSISEREVLTAAKAWANCLNASDGGAAPVMEAEAELLKAVMLLESREQIARQIAEEICPDCGNTPETGACFRCKMD